MDGSKKPIVIKTEDSSAANNKDLFTSLGMAASPQFAKNKRKMNNNKNGGGGGNGGMDLLRPTKSYDEDATLKPEMISLDVNQNTPEKVPAAEGLKNPFDDGPEGSGEQISEQAEQKMPPESNPFDDEEGVQDGWDDDDDDDIDFGGMAYDQ